MPIVVQNQFRQQSMSSGAPPAQKLVKTFNDTNYFAKGTYKRDYVEVLSTTFLANFISKTLLAPLERWRIIKQTQNSYQLRPQKFHSFSHYLTKVHKDQGWTAFWRGNGANLWIHFWQVIFQVGIYDTFRSSFNEFAYEMQNNPIAKFFLERIAAPFAAAVTSLLVIHPIDTARIRVSMNYHRYAKDMLFHSILSSWSYIRLEERSMAGIYKGYPIAVLISVLYLNIYNSFRNLYQQYKLKDNDIVDLIASKEAIGSSLALLLLHPLDTIKKNLQLNNQGKPKLFRNGRQVFRYTKSTMGVMHLYQGVTVTLTRNLLFCPIFALSLSLLDRNVKIFD